MLSDCLMCPSSRAPPSSTSRRPSSSRVLRAAADRHGSLRRTQDDTRVIRPSRQFSQPILPFTLLAAPLAASREPLRVAHPAVFLRRQSYWSSVAPPLARRHHTLDPIPTDLFATSSCRPETMAPTDDAMPGGGFYCSTSGTTFASKEALAEHYRSDFHRYNLKRKVAGLPPVTREWFDARKAQLASSDAAKSAAAERVRPFPPTLPSNLS